MLLMAAAGDPDAELVRGLCQGDRERAMTELYDRYARRIHGLGVRLLSDGALAEELVQETFVRLWRSSGRFDPSRGSARSFLFTLARRAAIDMHRRRPPAASPVPESRTATQPALTGSWRSWPCERPSPSSPTTTVRCSSWVISRI